MKHRIKTEVNKITGANRYTVQVKTIFGWSTCQEELGWGCSRPAVFYDIKYANDFIRERQIRSSWTELKD